MKEKKIELDIEIVTQRCVSYKDIWTLLAKECQAVVYLFMSKVSKMMKNLDKIM